VARSGPWSWLISHTVAEDAGQKLSPEGAAAWPTHAAGQPSGLVRPCRATARATDCVVESVLRKGISAVVYKHMRERGGRHPVRDR